MLGIMISEVGFFGYILDLAGKNGGRDNRYGYWDYYNWSISGAVMGMIGAILACVHHFNQHKFVLFGSVGFVILAFILFSLGLFIGSSHLQYAGQIVAIWFIFSFTCFQLLLNAFTQKGKD